MDTSRRGKKRLKSYRDKTQGANRSGEGGEEPAMWSQIWVTITRREREKKGHDIKRDKEAK